MIKIKNLTDILPFLCFMLLASPCITYADRVMQKTQQKNYKIENSDIDESSGLACSTRDKKLLWTHNDSGNMPIIYLMDSKGHDLASFHLDDVDANDWEDMDAFIYKGKHYLLIADTGDNYRIRFNYKIIIIEEPEINNKKGNSAIAPVWSISYQYEDGKSYDVEAVSVASVREKIMLFSKRTDVSYLFELPLKPEDSESLFLAKKITEFKKIKDPTASDISIDGQLLSINTYHRIHRFRRKNNSASNSVGWQYIDTLKYKKLFQPEALCLTKDKKHYFITSEKKAYLSKIKVP